MAAVRQLDVWLVQFRGNWSCNSWHMLFTRSHKFDLISVFTLNSDLDLSKVNRFLLVSFWTSVPNFMKIGLVLFARSSSQTDDRRRKRTNEHAWKRRLLAGGNYWRSATHLKAFLVQIETKLFNTGDRTSDLTASHASTSFAVDDVWYKITVVTVSHISILCQPHVENSWLTILKFVKIHEFNQILKIRFCTFVILWH